SLALRIVQRVRCDQHHAVELQRRIVEHALVRVVHGGLGKILLLEAGRAFSHRIAQRSDLSLVLQGLEISGVNARVAATTDKCQTDHGYSSTRCRGHLSVRGPAATGRSYRLGMIRVPISSPRMTRAMLPGFLR